MAPNDETRLKDMKYRELQKIAKEVGVKANLARPLLIQKILAAKFPDLPALRQQAALPADAEHHLSAGHSPQSSPLPSTSRGLREVRGAQDHALAQQEVKKCVPRRSARISGGAPGGAPGSA